MRAAERASPKLCGWYPAHAAFGGYKESGSGGETHQAMLDHCQQTKNLLAGCSPNALGIFCAKRR